MAYDKVRDNLLRRMAARQGLTLTRSRRRDPRALDYGLYWLADSTGEIVAATKAGVGMDEIEAFLTGSAYSKERL